MDVYTIQEKHTKSTLAAAAGTTTRYTRNTGHSTTSTPRLGGMLVAGLLKDGIWLTAVGMRTKNP